MINLRKNGAREVIPAPFFVSEDFRSDVRTYFYITFMNLHHGYCVNGYDFSLFLIQIEALAGLAAWHDDHD